MHLPLLRRALVVALAAQLVPHALAITSVAAAPASWSTPVVVSGTSASNGVEPTVGVDAQGNRVVVWVHATEVANVFQNDLRWRRFDAASGSWSAEQTLASPSGFVDSPELLVAPNGDMTLFWVDGGAGLNQPDHLRVVRLASGAAGWDPPTTLATAPDDLHLGDAVLAPDGAITVSWSFDTGAITNGVAVRRFAGGTWAPATTLSEPGDDAGPAVLGVDADGNVTAAWHLNVGNRAVPRVARFDATTATWSAPQAVQMDGLNARDANGLDVAVLPDGTAVVAYADQQGPTTAILAARYVPGVGWSAPETGLVEVVPRAAEVIRHLRMAVSPAGHLAVLYGHEQGDVGTARIVRNLGGPWSTAGWSAPVVFDPVPGSSAYPEALVADAAGRLTAIWQRWTGTADRLFATALDASGWSTPVPISGDGDDAGDLDVQVTASGSVVAVWARASAAEMSVFTPTSSPYHGVSPVRLADTRPGNSPDAVRVVPKVRVEPGSPLVVQVTDVPGAVPATGVAAVALNLTATDATGAGFVTVFPCGAQPFASNLNVVPGAVVANAVIAAVSVDGTVCLATSTAVHLVIDVNGWFPVGAGYTASSPVRLADTRPANSPDAVRAVAKVPVAPGAPLEIQVTDVPGAVPAAGVGAVVLNVTATGASSAGFVTVHGCGAPPFVSNLNVVPGSVVANLVVAPLSPSGTVCLATSVATDLVVDLGGWFAAGHGHTAVTPLRLLDTRPGNSPEAARVVPKVPVAPGAPLTVQVTDLAGSVPATGVGAVSLNVTTADAAADGYVTVYPCGPQPFASNVNVRAGATAANAVLASVSPSGTVCIATSSAMDLVVDLNGWFAG